MDKGLDRPIIAVGPMSGTTLDGVDAELTTSDALEAQAFEYMAHARWRDYP